MNRRPDSPIGLAVRLCVPRGALVSGANRSRNFIFVVAALCSLAAPATVRSEHFATPDDAVRGGREALDGWWDAPWYDDQADGLRRIDVRAPRPPRQPNWGGGQVVSDAVRWLGWALLAVLLAAAAYGLLWAWMQRASHRDGLAGHPGTTGPRRAHVDRVDVLPLPAGDTTTDLRAEARRHYEAGEYGRAMVYLFSYQLWRLDRSQVIHLARGKTNRQYLREVRSASGLGDLVAQSLTAFEEVFFGGRGLSRSRFEVCWEGLGRFETELRDKESA